MSAFSNHFALQLRGTLLVGLSGTLYGVLGYFGVQLLHAHFSITTMLFWRFFIASIWMLLSIFVANKNHLLKNANLNTILKTLILGTVSYSGASAFYFLATKHIGTGVAMVIFFSYPIFVALFAWMLSAWRMNKYASASLIAVLLGLVFLRGHGKSALDAMGILFAMIASFSYAVYVYGSKRTAEALDSRFTTLLICLGNSLLFLVLSLHDKSFTFPHTVHTWLYIWAFAIVATALPIQLLLDGLKYISPFKASILSVLEPVVTVLVGLVLLHETISSAQTLGIMIVLIGALLVQFERTYDPS